MDLLKSKPKVQQPNGFDNSRIYVWIKGLETKLNNLLREVDVIKNDFIEKNNDLVKEMSALREQLVETGHSQEEVKKKTELIIKELKQTAGLEDVMVLRKYIDLWNPLNFVTEKDVKRIFDNIINEKRTHKLERNKNAETMSLKGDTK